MVIALTFLLSIAPSPTDSCLAPREFSVASPHGHTIAAELWRPPAVPRPPAVMLVSGAGPSDRHHYTAYGNDAFRDITRALLGSGVAVVRFDEVGTGRSTGRYHGATTMSLAGDVSAVVAQSRRMIDVDDSRVVVLGYSEGAAIAAIVAAGDPAIAGVVLLAPPALPGLEIMDRQDAWRRTRDPDVAFLPAEERDRVLREERERRIASEPWFRFFLDFDPLPWYARVRAPTLILHGDADWRVSVDQAALVADAMRRGGNEEVTVTTLRGFDHAFSEPPSELADAAIRPIAPAVLARIRGWLADAGIGAPAPRAPLGGADEVRLCAMAAGAAAAGPP